MAHRKVANSVSHVGHTPGALGGPAKHVEYVFGQAWRRWLGPFLGHVHGLNVIKPHEEIDHRNCSAA